MIYIIQEIGVIQSVIIAACLGFLLGMLVVIVGNRVFKDDEEKIADRINSERAANKMDEIIELMEKIVHVD